MRILLWHGWLLEGSGSNVYTAKTAEVFRHQGHDVLILCQQPHGERLGFVDGWGTVSEDEIRWLRRGGAARGRGRVRLLRPEIGSLLPVFVVDDYEGFDEVKRFVDLTEDELNEYLQANVRCLKTTADWFHPEAVVAGHAVPGAVVANRALGPGAFVAKIHGSDIEYAMKEQDRYRDLAWEGLSGARAVAGATRDVLDRTVALVPEAAGRVRVVAPGVEVERFRPMPRQEALELASMLVAADPETVRGRMGTVDRSVRFAFVHRDTDALDDLARVYDQSVPDPDTPVRLHELSSYEGPLAGYFGKLIPQKGTELLLQAVALERELRAVVVGFGSFREWLAALVMAVDLGDTRSLRWLKKSSPMRVELTQAALRRVRNLSDRVTFTGRLDHRYAPAVLAALDVLVVPSVLEEAFGMVAAEGAASGALPLVARHSGLAEVAKALESAVDRPGLFSFAPGPGSVRRIAQGMHRLLDLPAEEGAALRGEVSRFVAAEWTWDRTAGRLLELCLGERIRPRSRRGNPAPDG